VALPRPVDDRPQAAVAATQQFRCVIGLRRHEHDFATIRHQVRVRPVAFVDPFGQRHTQGHHYGVGRELTLLSHFVE
jgi:hypothetical protein